MLEKLDLTKTLSKSEYKEKIMELEPKIGKLQRECKDLGIPVMIAFEGYDAAGKGVQIGELIKALDPRGFEVHAVKRRRRKSRCILSSGDSGPRCRQRDGLPYMTAAGTAKC